MAEPFKNLVNPASIARLAHAIEAVAPLDVAAFCAEATAGLEALELKARVAHVARALRPRLPAPWPDALAVLVSALPPREVALLGHAWLWPALQLVETHGPEAPTASLEALRQMTSRFSAEFAVRPLLAAHPEVAYAALARWADDPDEHVRRWVSEGSRPRLPWGMRLGDAVRDPSRGLALVERLVDDPSEYVRRSVANHVGDVAKDHPERAVALCGRWLAERPARAALVRHALRDLLKKGHPGALALLGQGASAAVADLAVTPGTAAAGEAVWVTATLRGEGRVRVDVVWAWPGARPGTWSRKTFVADSPTLAAGVAAPFRYRLSLRAVTTRPLRPGVQQVWLRVGGQDVGPAEFVLIG